MPSTKMQLQRGVTGFWHVRDPRLPFIDVTQFRTDLFQIARAVGGKVVQKPRGHPLVGCNFFDALLQAGGVPVRVLLNEIYPLAAFAQDWKSDASPLQFVDHAALAAAFAQHPHYTVLSAATLDSPITDEVIALLAAAEREQLAYWKPSRIGDIIFNFWD